MARTRRSEASELGASASADGSRSSQIAAGSALKTRSTSAVRNGESATTSLNMAPYSSTRNGRVTRASTSATSAISSASSPAHDWSGSAYTTPMTSNVPTPAPSTLAEGNKNQAAPKPAGNSIEVVLNKYKPKNAKPAPDTAHMLSRSLYAMTRKRKRDLVEESDEEFYSDTVPDTNVSSERNIWPSTSTKSKWLQGREDKDGGYGMSDQPPPEGLRPGLRRRGGGNLVSSTFQNVPPPSSSSSFVRSNGDDRGDDDLLSEPSRKSSSVNRRGISRNQVVVISDWEDEDVYQDEVDFGLDGSSRRKAPKQKTKANSSAKARQAPAKSTTKALPTRTRSKQTVEVKPGEVIDNIVELPKDSTTRQATAQNVNSDDDSSLSELDDVWDEAEEDGSDAESSDSDLDAHALALRRATQNRRAYRSYRRSKKARGRDRDRLESFHPQLVTMWDDLKAMPVLKAGRAEQPKSISRMLKPFQLEGLAWMKAMERTDWKGGLLGDEMGLGKTIQAVSLIMSDFPAKKPSLVLVPPVAMYQWISEIDSYTDGTLKTLIFHGTNAKTKNLTAKDLKNYDVIIMSYNSLESMYRKQEKGIKKGDAMHKQKSIIHQTKFHRVILDEAHSIKTRTTMTAKACFALQVEFRWCLTGTPLQNRIGEFFSLIRFLNIQPFACYLCKQCECSSLEWSMDDNSLCTHCGHGGMRHVSVFNQELLNPIQKYGNRGLGAEAFRKLRLMTDRIMLRRLKKDHTDSMELPVKEIFVDRQFFGEEENDFANSIMTSGQRRFDTYVAQGVLLNNYANIFGLIMQMRQVADHPDLILKKNSEGGQNVVVCCICDDVAEEAIRSRCKHDFCRACAKSYLNSTDEPDCPRCHIPLSIDLEQPELEQDELLVKKSSIINRIKMENWTSSSKIELLVHELHKLRSDKASHKSIIFSQFTTMLQLIEWRLRRAGITTVMLDGSMTPAQRQASIDHFMKNVEVECFLVSLKAGGVALNLTEASRVFIVDPWWNPAAEWQSADRCHRIGQTRPCTITRLCIEDSVESRMVLLQEKKTNMINSTINSDDAAMDSLSPEDLQFLFRGS